MQLHNLKEFEGENVRKRNIDSLQQVAPMYVTFYKQESLSTASGPSKNGRINPSSPSSQSDEFEMQSRMLQGNPSFFSLNSCLSRNPFLQRTEQRGPQLRMLVKRVRKCLLTAHMHSLMGRSLSSQMSNKETKS